MRKAKTSSMEKHPFRMVSLVFSLVCILTGFFCFQYYDGLRGTIHEESKGYLQEISNRIGSNISRTINDNYAVLDTLASIIEKSGLNSFPDILPLVEIQQDYWNYRDIIFIEENGSAYNANGKRFVLGNDTNFMKGVMDQSQGIYTTQMIDDVECIMLVVPMNEVQMEGKAIVALAAAYDPNTFEQVLSMSAFSEQAFSSIISKTGTVIVRSSARESFLKPGDNVVTTIENSKLVENSNIEDMKADINADVSGVIEFIQNDIRYYAIYTPVDPEDWYLITFVPVSVVNEKSDMLLSVTLVLCGVVALVFLSLLVILWLMSYRNKCKLESIAYVDEITGGNTIQKFYLRGQEILDAADSRQYALIYTNLKKFKVMNDQFGRNLCDDMLRSLHGIVNENLKISECIGRLSADNFCLLIEHNDEKELLVRLEMWQSNAEQYVAENKPVWTLPIVEFGIFVISSEDVSFPQMIDRAKMALRESAHFINSKLCFAFYDDEVRQQLLREKQLEDMMDAALQNKEFQVYLQPKFHLPEEYIRGAEALTRWVSDSEGMIFPDEFIPLFEKNGFIIQLDLYVFEEVCRKLREWLDRGYQPVKVSVNCSRAHLKNKDFLREYQILTEKYKIPKGLLEIELTESLVMGDTKRLIQVIEEIHSMGLGCSMDDFGSGYSSLNLIHSIPVDTLKLDRIFFESSNDNSDRMESVVECIVNMAKSLSIETVAEGVEYPEQVRMLKRIGCDYIQGYVFAKPMTIEAFEELAFGN